MTRTLTPESLNELADMVRDSRQVLAVGAETKPRLSAVECDKLSLRKLSGITDYHPAEFTVSAWAGTTLSEVTQMLASKGQYLPFDFFFVEAGGTLGGAIASGLSGAGRLRFGGLRDFILGLRMVDGTGTTLRMGSKVVKNAAGFDVPKFLVGSLGRFAIVAEATFKVFPSPPASLTLKLPLRNMTEAAEVLIAASNSRWEPAAVDVLPGTTSVAIQLRGPANSLENLASDILARWPGEALSPGLAQALWSELREFNWAPRASALIKVPLTPKLVPRLTVAFEREPQAILHFSGGGNVCYMSLGSPDLLSTAHNVLLELELKGLLIRGKGPLWVGATHRPFNIVERVKVALDPQNRFPSLES